MDALASFLYLTNNLPTWISQINTLSTHVIEKREEFIAEYKRVLKHARPKRKRTPSVTSFNTDKGQTSSQSQKDGDTISIPRPTDISPLEPANKYLFANARRGRRRLGTSIRSGASGPSTFRNQHQVIIYYDSTLQNSFEKLVKEIGLARNNVRKGKQAKELERGLQLPSFGTRSYTRTQRGPTIPSPPKCYTPTVLTPKPEPLPTAVSPPPSDDTSFTVVSKDLESAQTLCESAAHQFLRDGDCTFEIDRIRALLENVLQVAHSQITAWEQEKVKNTIQTAAGRSPTPVETLDVAATVVAEKLAPSFITPHQQPPPVTVAVAELEVDSDDSAAGDDMVFNMSTFRAARVNGLRA